jgi:hypothetical protein
VETELGGYAEMIATAAPVDTKRWVPSVFTLSGSSTPWTWTFVPVNVGTKLAWPAAAASKVFWSKVKEVPPIMRPGPPNKTPVERYRWALPALAATKPSSWE